MEAAAVSSPSCLHSSSAVATGDFFRMMFFCFLYVHWERVHKDVTTFSI
jgi:hypothetical protein